MEECQRSTPIVGRVGYESSLKRDGPVDLSRRAGRFTDINFSRLNHAESSISGTLVLPLHDLPLLTNEALYTALASV